MYKTIYEYLLFLYPPSFRQQYGSDTLLILSELYQEELNQNHRLGVKFWISQYIDLLKNICAQHWQNRQYTLPTILGIVFLLPFFSMMALDLVGRIVQGDLLHTNLTLYHTIYNTPLYWAPVLIAWVFIFPATALIINLIPLITKHKENVLNGLIIAGGIGVLLFIFVHDFVGCAVTNTLHFGLLHVFKVLSTCRNA